jgi:hypothetical protein
MHETGPCPVTSFRRRDGGAPADHTGASANLPGEQMGEQIDPITQKT